MRLRGGGYRKLRCRSSYSKFRLFSNFSPRSCSVLSGFGTLINTESFETPFLKGADDKVPYFITFFKICFLRDTGNNFSRIHLFIFSSFWKFLFLYLFLCSKCFLKDSGINFSKSRCILYFFRVYKDTRINSTIHYISRVSNVLKKSVNSNWILFLFNFHPSAKRVL